MPFGGEFWLANFAAGGFPLTAVTTCPDPNMFCAVVRGAGYTVRVDDPQLWSGVRAHPVEQVIPDLEHELLLLADFTRIVAYGAGGLVWSASFVLDGLKILSRTGTSPSIPAGTRCPRVPAPFGGYTDLAPIR